MADQPAIKPKDIELVDELLAGYASLWGDSPSEVARANRARAVVRRLAAAERAREDGVSEAMERLRGELAAAEKFHERERTEMLCALEAASEYVDGLELLRRIRHEPLLRAAYNLGRYDLGRQQPSSAPSPEERANGE